MRKIGFVFAIVVVLMALVLAALSLFVDVNQYRGLIQAQLERQLERKVTLGKMTLGLLPLRFQVDEPVIADDLEGLRLLRDRAPAGMHIAAGEYGYDLGYFHRLLNAQSVDFLQADVTRCCGITGFLQAATLCEAHHVPLSAHCAPAQHVHVGCAALPFQHLEYFHDHVRIERMLFDGLPELKNGELRPDLSSPGCGLEFKRADAEKFRV